MIVTQICDSVENFLSSNLSISKYSVYYVYHLLLRHKNSAFCQKKCMDFIWSSE